MTCAICGGPRAPHSWGRLCSKCSPSVVKPVGELAQAIEAASGEDMLLLLVALARVARVRAAAKVEPHE